MPDYQPFMDSSEYSGNSERLSEVIETDGYLFLRGLIDPERALRVKRDIMAILREHHIIEDDCVDEPTWSGGPHPTEAEYMRFYDKIVRLESFNALAESPEIIALAEGVTGDSVRCWTQRLFRVMYPDPDAAPGTGVGAHQDGNPQFGYKAPSFYTCWLPLIDIDARMGGLAVAPGSHKLGMLEHAGAAAPSSAKAMKTQGFGLDASKLSWATGDFHPGDAVFFTNLTAHHGLINRADRIRMSCDFRYQSTAGSASWIANMMGPDIRRIGQQIDELLAGRAIYVTTHADQDTLDYVRRLMLAEQATTLERAQQLVAEVQERAP